MRMDKLTNPLQNVLADAQSLAVGLEVFGSRVGIGLFHEFSELENTRGQFRTPTNVPIARLRSRGHHAKGDKVP